MTHDSDSRPAELDPELMEHWRRRRQQVDPAVAERLAAARQQAVALLDGPERKALPRLLPWGAALTSAAALLLAIVFWPGPGDSGLAPLPLVDADELAAARDLELLEELEFIAWLDEQQADHAPAG